MQKHTERTYTVIVHRHHDDYYVAEVVQYPAIEGRGDTPAKALAELRAQIATEVQQGEPEVSGDVITTVVTVPAVDGAQHAYLALLTPDGQGGYSSYCPATGTASMGATPDEARAMLAEATALYLEDRVGPPDAADVRIERVTLTLPDAPDAKGVRHAQTPKRQAGEMCTGTGKAWFYQGTADRKPFNAPEVWSDGVGADAPGSGHSSADAAQYLETSPRARRRVLERLALIADLC